MMNSTKTGDVRTLLILFVSLAFFAFQVYIIFYPQVPMIQRPAHWGAALALTLLCRPLVVGKLPRFVTVAIDAVLILGVLATLAYFLLDVDRLTGRMENVDPVFLYDIVFGIIMLLTLLEGVRRTVGWSLLGVIFVFIAYAFFGNYLFGWLRFYGFSLDEGIEILTMTSNGILGITTETSLLFVFYFVTFGAVYSAIGGGQLFIDVGLRIAGLQQGGAAKAAIVSSSLMGSISGSAVANVSATGIFTIPLMRRSGFSAERAASTEAIASTGGQLMPPIMGVAAFVMAELLQYDYGRIALAGIIPAVAFYLAIFIYVDLTARKTGVGTINPDEELDIKPIAPRLYLLIPPVVLISVLVTGYSATFAAVVATASCFVTAYLKRSSWLSPRDILNVVRDATKQAAEVAVPIAAIGIIIAVAIQSNLALKFSTQLLQISGGTTLGAMVFVILGCIIMGMGLPTVAAYIIGAILFVPALLDLGIEILPAHFFVMYYCVLSMVTPPVALASYTAAGIAGANSMSTSLLAFKVSLVAFFIPFAFAFDPALLGLAAPLSVAIACSSLFICTMGWAVAMVGWLGGPVNLVVRILLACGSTASIFFPSGETVWFAGMAITVPLLLWLAMPMIIRRKVRTA